MREISECPGSKIDNRECSPSPDRLHSGAVESTANLRSHGVTRKMPPDAAIDEMIPECDR
jgi:hypothetical protein